MSDVIAVTCVERVTDGEISDDYYSGILITRAGKLLGSAPFPGIESTDSAGRRLVCGPVELHYGGIEVRQRFDGPQRWIWDVPSMKSIAIVPGEQVQLSPDGREAASYDPVRNTVVLTTLESGKNRRLDLRPWPTLAPKKNSRDHELWSWTTEGLLFVVKLEDRPGGPVSGEVGFYADPRSGRIVSTVPCDGTLLATGDTAICFASGDLPYGLLPITGKLDTRSRSTVVLRAGARTGRRWSIGYRRLPNGEGKVVAQVVGDDEPPAFDIAPGALVMVDPKNDRQLLIYDTPATVGAEVRGVLSVRL